MEESTVLKLKVQISRYRYRKYIWCIDQFHLEVKPSDLNIEKHIERMETNPVSGDYSFSDDCSIRLVCKSARIKAGSCHFT